MYWSIYVKSPKTNHCFKYQCRYHVLIYLCEITPDQSLLQISVQISCTDLFMWNHLRPIIASNISADIIYWFIYVKSPQTNHCFKYQCRYHILIYLCEITSDQSLLQISVPILIYLCEVTSDQSLLQISVQISYTDLFMWNHLRPIIASNISADIIYWFIYVKSPQTNHCFKNQCRYHILIYLCEVTSDQALLQISVQISCIDLLMWNHPRPTIASNMIEQSNNLLLWGQFIANLHSNVIVHRSCHYSDVILSVMAVTGVRHRSKETSKLHVTGLCEGSPVVTGEFPWNMASNAENVSIWWCHHVIIHCHHGANLDSNVSTEVI